MAFLFPGFEEVYQVFWIDETRSRMEDARPAAWAIENTAIKRGPGRT
jgi:hypothetical protein